MEMRFKSVAVVTILLFLFGVSIASAADREERLFSKQPGKSSVHMLQVGKRHGKPGAIQYFLKSLGAGCESGCCWAEANCAGGDVECSESRCDAWCGDGSHAGYSCNAT